MPDEVKNLIFTAKYDNSGFTQGVAENIADLQALTTQQQKLQTACDQTQAALDEVTQAMKTNDATIQHLDKEAANFAKTEQALKEQGQQLAAEREKLTAQLGVQQTALKGVKTAAEAAAAAFKGIADTTAKNPIKPIFDAKAVLAAAQNLKAGVQGTLKGFDFSGFEELQAKLVAAKDEFKQLEIVIGEAKKQLATLDPNTQEWQDLNNVVKAGEQVLENYNEAQEETGQKSLSLRSQIQALRNELTRLEEAGLENTEVYRQTELEAARLTDQYGDMQNRIRILASDTKNLDLAMSAVNFAAAGFQTVTGAMELFGFSSEAAAEAQRRLLAIMSLVQGLTQIQNMLLKENTLITLGADRASKLFAATQKILALAFGEATVSTTAFRAALLSTGIGAIVVALGFLISKMMEFSSSTDDATDSTQRLTQALDDQKEALDNNLAALDHANKLRIEHIKQQGGTEAEIYQANSDLVKDKINALQDELDTLFNQHNFFTGIIGDDATIKKRNEQLDKINERIKTVSKQLSDALNEQELDAEQEKTRIAEKGRADRKKLDEAAAAAAKKLKEQQDRENEAAAQLQVKIHAELLRKSLSDEAKEIADEQDKFEEQQAILIKGNQSTAELEKLHAKTVLDIHDKFRRERVKQEKELQEQIEEIQAQASAARIENIKDRFAQEIAAVNNEAKNKAGELQKSQTAALDAALSAKTSGAITESQYADAVAAINATFDRLFEQLNVKTKLSLQKIGAEAFQAFLDGIQESGKVVQERISEQASKEVSAAAQLYITGVINYKQFQEKLTQISKDETKKRLEQQKLELEQQLAAITLRINLGSSTPEEKAGLLEQSQAIRTQIAQTQAEIDKGEADQVKSSEDKAKQKRDIWIQSYSQIADAVVTFLHQIDAAEQQRLERQISFQKQRVEFAKQIADKGNAEYLEQEQKRLDELQRQQEEHANKQIAIDAALTASKAALAVVSAVADSGSPYTAIIAVASVIAALGAAISFVQSFKAPVPTFYEGTEYATGKDKGRDKIPAMINEGERVVPTDRNKDYFQTLSAIHHRQIPPSVLNNFVAKYSFDKMPVHDYGRLRNATEFYQTSTLADSHKLSLINDNLEKLNETFENHQDDISISMDEHGFSLSLIKTMKRIKLLKRT